jgi:hypothetical protein
MRFRFQDLTDWQLAVDIAEGSGSHSKKEFQNFLNVARRSTLKMPTCLSCFKKGT